MTTSPSFLKRFVSHIPLPHLLCQFVRCLLILYRPVRLCTHGICRCDIYALYYFQRKYFNSTQIWISVTMSLTCSTNCEIDCFTQYRSNGITDTSFLIEMITRLSYGVRVTPFRLLVLNTRVSKVWKNILLTSVLSAKWTRSYPIFLVEMGNAMSPQLDRIFQLTRNLNYLLIYSGMCSTM